MSAKSESDLSENLLIENESNIKTPKSPWVFTRWGFGLTILFTSLIAMWATLTIVIERSILENDSSYTTSCDINPWLSCGQVMQSWQAMTFGFPNTYIGIVGFSVLITVAMSILAGADFKKWYWITMNIGQAAAFAFCIWLWYSAVYSIGTLCLYCMVVWLMVTIQIAVITARNVYEYTKGTSSSYASTLILPFIVLIVVIVAASVIAQFGTGILGF